jgi:hypothetical protein
MVAPASIAALASRISAIAVGSDRISSVSTAAARCALTWAGVVVVPVTSIHLGISAGVTTPRLRFPSPS